MCTIQLLLVDLKTVNWRIPWGVNKVKLIVILMLEQKIFYRLLKAQVLGVKVRKLSNLTDLTIRTISYLQLYNFEPRSGED